MKTVGGGAGVSPALELVAPSESNQQTDEPPQNVRAAGETPAVLKEK